MSTEWVNIPGQLPRLNDTPANTMLIPVSAPGGQAKSATVQELFTGRIGGSSSNGVTTIDVRSLATVGDGSSQSPFAGWDTPLIAALKAGTTCLFRSGCFAHSQTLNFGRYPNVSVIGERGTVLKYTGTGKCIELRATVKTTNDELPTEPHSYGHIFQDIIIDGSGSGIIGLYIERCHHGEFRNVAIRNVTQKGLETNFVILGLFSNLRITSRIGNAAGTASATTNPVTGIYLGGTIQPDAVTQACHFINPIIEKVTGDGIVLENCWQTTFEGGASETNGGRNLVVNAAARGNKFSEIDLEGSAVGIDADVYGDQNIFENILIFDDIRFKNGANRNTVIGGQLQNLKIESGAQATRLISVNCDLRGGGVFSDLGTDTEIIGAVRSISTGNAMSESLKLSRTTSFDKTVQVGGELNVTGRINAGADVILANGRGVVMHGPDGSLRKLKVNNDGTVTSEIYAVIVSDNFAGESLSSQWQIGEYRKALSDLVSLTVNGNVSIALASGAPGDQFKGLIGAERAFGNGNIEQIHWTQFPSLGSKPILVEFYLYLDDNNFVAMFIDGSPATPTIVFAQFDNSVYTVLNTIPFDAATMAFWRFRNSSDTIIFETSATGSGWTQRASTTVSFTLAYMKVAIQAGTTGAASAPGTAIVDDYVRG